jgi:DNA repair protein RecO (recombination protein O)
MKPVVAEALVLRLTCFGEADLVVQLLTRDLGLVSVVARSARKSRRRFGAPLDYFCLVRADVRPGRGGLGTLQGVDLLQAFHRVRTDVGRFWTGCQFLEVARLGLREADPAPQLFALLLASLEALDRGADPGSLARVYQTRALSALGYGLSVETCPTCSEPLIPVGAVYGAEVAGRITCRSCGPADSRSLSPGAVQTLRAALRLPLARLGTLRISTSVEQELKPALEAALASALGGRPRSFDGI